MRYGLRRLGRSSSSIPYAAIRRLLVGLVFNAVLFEVGVVKIFLETLDERDGCLHPGSAYDALSIAVLREDIHA